MNKNYIRSLIAVSFFTFTTIVLFVVLRDPLLSQLSRTHGLSDGLAVAIVSANFVGLTLSLIAFIYQRAHKNLAARRHTQTLESFAERARYEEIKIPEATIVRHEDLLRLRDPFVVVSIPAQGRLTSEHVEVGQVVKLTSPVEPRQYVIVEVVAIADDVLRLRRTSP